MKKLFTSESVTEGHPDKVCDQISDAVLDAILAQDPMARVACECSTCTGLVLVMGEITTDCYVNIDEIARNTLRRIGYDRAKYGFDADSCAVLTSLHGQSPDIAQGVDSALETREHRQAGHRRGRSGHDVRLCVRRNARVHANGYRAGSPRDATSWPRYASRAN